MKMETRGFERAEDLLTALRFSGTDGSDLPWHRNGNARDWLFRGLANHHWPLIPSAMRKGKVLPRSPDGIQIDEWIKATPPGWSHRDQIQSEHALIWRFFRMTDTQGLRLPDGSAALTHSLSTKKFIDAQHIADWPRSELWPLVALTQHYLVPTRVLDWSRKPLIAAYFAAQDCAIHLEDNKPCERLAIWVLYRPFVKTAKGFDLITAPRADNPNLHLQSGVFTVLRPEFNPDAAFDPDIFDLQAYCEGHSQIEPALWKLTLVANEAGRLLTMLRDEFIQSTTIHAGYHGAAQSVLEHRLRKPR